MPNSSCPDDPTLAQLLAGRLPAEQAEVHELHLAHCAACAVKAAELESDDDLAEALCATDVASAAESATDGPVVSGLIQRLSGMADHPNLALLPTDDELRSALNPPESDGELGRIGEYRVLEVLGAGAMGIVFKAEDMQLGRGVAVKVMRPHLAASRDACRRFRREACAVAAFENHHIVTIYDVGEDGGTPYFAMQLLEGESLRGRLARTGKLSPREVLRIGREIALGLDAAHSRGLLHRDIKPDNVWLEAEGDQVKIVDFGLARAVDQTSFLSNSGISHSGAIMGTPKYMAPEQINGENVDERCDLFSLGSLLYHLATGEPPFSGKNVVATLISVSQDEVAPPRNLNPDVPEQLSNLILQLLAKDPDDRIQTAAEVVRQIAEMEALLDQETLPTKSLPTKSLPTKSLPTKSLPTEPPHRRRFPFWLLAAAGGILVVAATIIYVATDKGTLVIETDDDAVAVFVDNGMVTIRDHATGRQWVARIGVNRLKPGDYEIATKEKGSDIEIVARELRLLHDGQQRVRLSILRGEQRRVHLSLRGKSKVPARQPPSWLNETEDSLGIEPGDPLSPQSLVSNPTRLSEVTSWTVEPVEHGWVRDIAYAPDGTLIATAGQDGTVRIWDTADRQLRNIIVCPGPVTTIAWTDDGAYLASAQSGPGTGSICIWKMRGERIRLVRKINRGTGQIAWSPDGQLLAFQDNGVQLWDFESGEILPNFGVVGTISRRPWSADSSMLATTMADKGIALWNVGQRKPVKSFANVGADQAIWSHHGAFVACLHKSVP